MKSFSSPDPWKPRDQITAARLNARSGIQVIHGVAGILVTIAGHQATIALDPAIIPRTGARLIIPYLSNDGGAAGDIDTDCTWTYSATDQDGNTLGEGLTPALARMPGTPYTAAEAGTYGLGFKDPNGNFVLLIAFDEHPTTTVVTNVIGIGFDGGGDLIVDTQRQRVLATDTAGDDEIPTVECDTP